VQGFGNGIIEAPDADRQIKTAEKYGDNDSQFF
jgi:hypothetical protein